MDDFDRQASAALRGFMSEHGVTQQQVADSLGRSQGYVSHRLGRRQALTVDIIAAVAALAHISPRALWVEVESRIAAGNATQ